MSATYAVGTVWRLIYAFCRSSLTSYGVNWSSDFLFFIGLLLLRAGPYLIVGFPLFSQFSAPSVTLLSFLPYHFVIPAVVLFDPCLPGLFWAYCMFFFQWLSIVIGFILILLWAFLIHYIACGLICPISFFLDILGPFASLGILGPFSNSTFPWVFTNSFGLPWPNYHWVLSTTFYAFKTHS